MADIYDDTLSANGNSGDLTVEINTGYGLNVTGETEVQMKFGSTYNNVGVLRPGSSKLVFPTSTTMRLVDRSGAANPCKLSN